MKQRIYIVILLLLVSGIFNFSKAQTEININAPPLLEWL